MAHQSSQQAIQQTQRVTGKKLRSCRLHKSNRNNNNNKNNKKNNTNNNQLYRNRQGQQGHDHGQEHEQQQTQTQNQKQTQKQKQKQEKSMQCIPIITRWIAFASWLGLLNNYYYLQQVNDIRTALEMTYNYVGFQHSNAETTTTATTITSKEAVAYNDNFHQSQLSSNFRVVTKAVVDTAKKLDSIAKELNELSIRYYMYDNPNITLLDGSSFLYNNTSKYKDRYSHDRDNDMQMLQALRRGEQKSTKTTNNNNNNNKWRTFDPNQADVFVVPIPMTQILMSEYCDFETPMTALVQEELYQKHYGNNHVLISTNFALFRHKYKSHTGMKNWYYKLYNVTVVQSWDPCATYNAICRDNADWGEYTVSLKQNCNRRPFNKKCVSVGLGSSNSRLQLQLASMTKFQQSSYFVFYHSTTSTSVNNSTIYRHAPIMNVALDQNFPKSSIGWPIENVEEWQRRFKDSRFCLVIRGDTPHSHALWRSIRVGCIPIIASDHLPVFAPMFKSTLINMADYAIVLNEQDLVNDPGTALLKALNDMTEEDIAIKLLHLAFAQRVIFTDHPKSLFIPAFLKEVTMASEAQYYKF